MKNYIKVIFVLFISFNLWSEDWIELPGASGVSYTGGNVNSQDVFKNTTSANKLAKIIATQQYLQAYKSKVSSYDCGDDSDCKKQKAYMLDVVKYNQDLLRYYANNGQGTRQKKPTSTSSCPGNCLIKSDVVSDIEYEELSADDLKKQLYKNFSSCTKKVKRAKDPSKIKISPACQASIDGYLASLAKNGDLDADFATLNYEGPQGCSKIDNIFKYTGMAANLFGGACNGIMATKYSKGELDLSTKSALNKCMACKIAMPKGKTICDTILSTTLQALQQRNAQILSASSKRGMAGSGFYSAPGSFPTDTAMAYANSGVNSYGSPTTAPGLTTNQGVNSYNTANSRVGGQGNVYNQQYAQSNSYTAGTNSLSTYSTLTSYINPNGSTMSSDLAGRGTGNPLLTRGAGRSSGNLGDVGEPTNVNRYLDLVQYKAEKERILQEEINPQLYDTCYVGGNTALANYMLHPTDGNSVNILKNNMDCFDANIDKALVVSDVVSVKNAMLCQKYRKQCDNTFLDMTGGNVEYSLNEFAPVQFADILNRFHLFASVGTTALHKNQRKLKVKKIGPLTFKTKRYKIHTWKDILKARISYVNYMWNEYKRTFRIARAKAKVALKQRLSRFKKIVTPTVLNAQLKYVKTLRTKTNINLKNIQKQIELNKRALLALKSKSKKKYLALKKEQKGLKRLKVAMAKTYKTAKKYQPVYRKAFNNIYEFRKDYYNYWYLRRKLSRRF